MVEMKQWSQAYRYDESAVLATVPSYVSRPVSHPLDQVRGYCEYLTDFTATLSERNREVAGVAYLHNASDDGVRDLLSGGFDSRVKLFTGQQR
jgi:uncharacterized protein